MTRPELQTGLIVDQLFRQKWRETVVVLTRRFGTAHIDDIEDAVQAAMERALQTWSLSGPPKNPGGWIYTTASNILRDRFRHQAVAAARATQVESSLYERDSPDEIWTEPLDDDVLKMILACCHASLSPRESIAVTLRLVCGLGLNEIAAGLLAAPDATKKLLTRAKAKLRDHKVPLDIDDTLDLSRRRDRAMQIIYLLFNEGYAANTGDQLVRSELITEALRLAELMLASELGKTPEMWALASLMALQAARLPARTDETGNIVLLADQDRRLWDRAILDHGRQCLERSMTGGRRSAYHLEAAIAACHAASPSYAATDWRQILDFYDDLIDLTGSPVAALNRAVAVMMADGPQAGLTALEPLQTDKRLANTYLLPAVAADFHRRAGNTADAERHYNASLALAGNIPVRDFLAHQLNALSIA